MTSPGPSCPQFRALPNVLGPDTPRDQQWRKRARGWVLHRVPAALALFAFISPQIIDGR